MLQVKIKNIIRLLVAILNMLMREKKLNIDRIYFNLIGGNITGGPDRFLKSIRTSEALGKSIEITNWSLKGCKSALVFSSSWGPSFSVMCRLLKVKSVLRVDGFYVPEDKVDQDFQQPKKFRLWLNNRLKYDLESFDHVIYQSNFSKKICDRYLFNRRDNFSIISNGTNINKFKFVNKETSDTIKIIVLGKHYPKHLNLALNIFSEVLEAIPAELVIIGPMRNGVDGVQDHINHSSVGAGTLKFVRCLGIRTYDELPALLSNADIFLHVKVGDWCPNAVLEAMASGLPVVCPSWGGTKELVGNAGIIVDGPEWGVDDSLISGMVDGVITLSQNLNYFKKLARSRAESHFNIEDTSKQYLEVLGVYPSG